MQKVPLNSFAGLVALFQAALGMRLMQASTVRPKAGVGAAHPRRAYAASGENSIGEHDRAIRAWIDGGREGPRPQRNGRPS